MKRYILIALATALILLCACSKTPEPTEPASEAPSTQPTESEMPTIPPSESSEPSESQAEPEVRFELTDQRLNVYRNRAEEIWAQVIAKVKNTSDTPMLLEDAPMRVCNAEGKSLAADETVEAFPQIVQPGETGYYYVETYLDTDSTDGLTLELEPKAVAAAEAAVNYTIVDSMLSDSRYGGLELVATVRNFTEQDSKHFCIAALLLDADGHLIGMLSDVPFQTIPAGSSSLFELSSYMLPESLKSADVAETRVLAYELMDS